MFNRNGALYSAIYVFDFNQEEPLATFEAEGVCYLGADFEASGTAVCVGDAAVTMVDTTSCKRRIMPMGRSPWRPGPYTTARPCWRSPAYSGASEGTVRVIGPSGKETASVPVAGEVGTFPSTGIPSVSA